MWIREIREYDEQNAEQVELKLCPNPKTTMIKYFQVFFKKPKKTYNTCMFESNWEYVTTMVKNPKFGTIILKRKKINFKIIKRCPMFQRKGNVFIVKNLVITFKNVTKKNVDEVEASQINQTNSVVDNKYS